MPKKIRHTPGPWRAEIDQSGTYKSSGVYGARRVYLHEPVAAIPHDDITEEGWAEMEANVQLIVAAPDLLVAGEMICDLLERGEQIRRAEIQVLRDAIVKAGGEGSDG